MPRRSLNSSPKVLSPKIDGGGCECVCRSVHPWDCMGAASLQVILNLKTSLLLFFCVASYCYSAPFSPFLLHFEVKTIPIFSWIIFPFSFAMNWWVLIYTYLKLIFKLSLENGWMDIFILSQFTDIFLNILP